MTKINVNSSPYFDDFNAKKKYQKLLFRAKRPVQVRELNQLQSIIKNQIERFGSHIFENGAQVYPGGPNAVRFDNETGYVKIDKSNYANSQAELETYWLNQYFTSSNGTKGLVVGVRAPDSLDEARLFVKYTSAGGGTGERLALEPLESFTTDETGVSATVKSNGIGKCTSVSCEESIYYFDGNFILVDKQIYFVLPDDPENQADWTTTPTCKVGLEVVESVVTYEDDPSILDNATGTANEFAPGADRLAIDATLVQKDINDTDSKNFIELMRINSGIVQLKVMKTEYSVLEDTLARRTYDESGDYTVRPFIVNAKPFLRENENGGVHLEAEFEFDTKAEAELAALTTFGIVGASLSPTNGSKWLPGLTYDDFLTAARGKLSLVAETGKAYVKGYEIEKLAPSVIDIDRARTLKYQANKGIACNLGTYVFITNVFGIPNLEGFETVNVYRERVASVGTQPGGKIGTAKAIAIEYYSGTHGAADAVYKLYLYDLQADSDDVDFLQMKSIHCESPSFTANLVLEEFKMTGAVSTSGSSSSVVGTGTAWNNDSTQKLKNGDYIKVGANYHKINATVSSDTALTIATPADLGSNQPFYYVYAVVNGLQNEAGLIYRLPNESIYTIRGNSQDNIVTNSYLSTYSVRRINSVGANPSGLIELPVLGAGEEYADFSPNDYIAVQITGSPDATTTWLNLTDSNVSPAGVNCTITGAAASANYIVISTIRKESGSVTKERSKTLVRNAELITASGSSDLSKISLNKCDILAIKNIYMSSSFSVVPTSSDTDITSRYELDNGQRDYVYDIGSIKLKAGEKRPTGRLLVVFDYFTHGNDGNYFSVDSYPFKGSGANMTYEEIPVYYSVTSGGRFDLRSSIDFRARVDESSPTAFSIISELPRGLFTANYHHYLNRIDKLYLDKTGEFKINYGKPEIEPQTPADVPTGMTMYELFMGAYTATPDDCVRKFVENKRYTMRDIGKLERRISNLEYYTTLSLLEKETKDLELLDANGNSRFKNGFLVDNFSGHSVGDVQSTDYKCSIDIEQGELRPIFYSDNIKLIEKNSLEPESVPREQRRQSSHYQKTGDVYTLPYTESAFLSQKVSSKVANINPFGVFTFVGRVKLTPWSDEWYDTETVPRLLVEDNNSFDSIAAGLKSQGTIWGEWTTNWTGKETISVEKRRGPVVKRGKNKPDANHKLNWPVYRQRLTRVTETETGTKTRSGFRQEARITGTIEQSLGKKIINQYAAPYIRSREIAFSGKAFLPNTKLYPFFDNVDVSAYCKPDSGAYGDPLVSDGTGSISGTFRIPNSSAVRFETGDRIFRLTTDAENKKDPRPTSHGESNYVAKGIINVEQETVLSTRQFEIVTIPVVESESVSRPNQFDIPGPIVKEDPIAQSFFINESGGCFLTSVDLYFYSKDLTVPVKLQVRPLGPEGTPINKVVPFGEVVKAAEDVITNHVDLEMGKLTVSGLGSPWISESGKTISSSDEIALSDLTDLDMIPTRFTFDSPVYLQEGEDYAIVLLADSIAYNVWVSQYGKFTTDGNPVNANFLQEGEVDGEPASRAIGTSNAILKDPYINGVFFKSVNGRSWVQDQTLDIKFKLNKAVFDISTSGVIQYVNEEVPRKVLSIDPFYFANGESLVRVSHPDHGLPVGSRVVFQPAYNVNVTGTVSSSGTTVTGTGTTFDTELVVGSVIMDLESGQQRRVTARTSSSITTNSAFSPVLSAGSVLVGTSFIVPTGASLAGVEVEDILTEEGFEVSFAELDSYVVDITSNATATGSYGGANFTGDQCKQIHTANLVFSGLNFSQTSTAVSLSTTTGADVAGVNSPFLVEDYINIEPNSDIEFGVPMMISSAINEKNATDTPAGPSTVNATDFFTDLTSADQKSLHCKVILRSTNSNLSPIVDSSRLSLITVSNRLDAWQPEDLEILDDDTFYALNVPMTNPTVSSTANELTFTAGSGTFTTEDADIAKHLSKLDVGKYVDVSGTTSGTNDTDGYKRVISVEYTPSETVKCSVTLDHAFGATGVNTAASIVITQKDRFIDELAPKSGSASSKYLTKRLTLARPASAARVSFTAYRDASAEIETYYKLLRTDDSRNFDDIEYQLATYNVDVNGILTDMTPDASTSTTDYAIYEATLNDLPEFSAIAVKIVMKGTNPARPPKIRDLSIIALED